MFINMGMFPPRSDESHVDQFTGVFLFWGKAGRRMKQNPMFINMGEVFPE